MKNLITTTLFITLSLILTSSASADEFCRPCPFDCISIGVDSSHCGSRGVKSGLCCVDLDNDGQNQLRNSNYNNSNYNNSGYNNSGYNNSNECPSGFSPRDHRCSDSERASGCKDSRSSRGRSCIKWSRAKVRGRECPRGFSLRARRCSPQEKARGCKDMKSRSGGRTCIRF